uniref:WD_REPEATS_REGION domain-containing protein n=1 Tax=Hydatigena taeniaeformis TaxID=6205 RepID=A0A0R3WXD1_HYDTA
LAVIGNDGDFRVWDLKSETVLLHTTLQTPSSTSRRLQGEGDGGDVEMQDEPISDSLSGFLCMAAPQPDVSATANIVDIVAVAGHELIVFVPCRPPPLEEISEGSKKIPLTAFELSSVVK